VILQDISRRALSAGFAREQKNDECGAEHRDKQSTATVPSCRTMRYGVTTGFRVSSSIHGNLSCACDGACSIQSDNCFSMVGLPVRCRVSLLFEHSVLGLTTIQVLERENATRCVQTLAELTRNRIKGYCGRGVPYVNQFTSAEIFFLAGMSSVVKVFGPCVRFGFQSVMRTKTNIRQRC
jgi:hypothetical protein